MLYFYVLLGTFAIAAMDQISKYFTVQLIPQGSIVPAIDGLFHLTHIHNTGAAFSILEGALWFFFIMTTVFFVLAFFAIQRKWVHHPLGYIALTMVCGGALGNLIDRVMLGYVVDMIGLDFMEFAIFNVADSFICVGAALFLIWAIFFDKETKKTAEEPLNDNSTT